MEILEKAWKKGAVLATSVLVATGLLGFGGYTYSENKTLEQHIRKTEDKLVEQSKLLEDLKQTNEQVAGKLTETEKNLADEKQQREDLQKQLETKQSELDQKQKEASDKDSVIASKDKEIDNLKKMKASRKAKASATPTPMNNAPKEKAQAQPAQAQAAPEAPKKEEVKASSNAMTFRATAYSSQEPLEMGGGVTTASGTRVTEGRTIAVDPSVIPLGSKVRITCPDYPSVNGVYTAEDTGGAIKGNIIDIYIHDLSEVNSFGRRTIQVEIL